MVLSPVKQLLLSIGWVKPTDVATEHTGLNDGEKLVAFCGLEPEGEYMVHSDPEAGKTGCERNSLAEEGVPKTYE